MPVRKWKNRNLPRGVLVDPRGYVYVRLFRDGCPLPKKCFGKVSSASLDEAESYLNVKRGELKRGETGEDKGKLIRWPFARAMEKFLEVKPKWRYFAPALISFFNGYYFDELWFSIVEEYRPFRLKQRVKKSKTGRYVTDPSVNKELACLSSMFYTLKRLKQLEKIPNVKLPSENPTKGVKKVDDTHYRRKRIISPDEFGKIMVEASPRMRRRILAALNTGLRRKDIFALKKDNLDPYMKQLEGLMHKVGASYKTVANEVMEELYATAEGGVVVDNVNHDREFDALRETCRTKYNMPDFIFKDFRRTAAWTVWQKEKNIFEVMALLNHKKVTTTQRYLGITGEDMEAAGRALADTFNFRAVPIATEAKSKIESVPITVPIATLVPTPD